MSKTLIQQADWAVVWDAQAQRHVYRRDVDVVLADDRITHVGASGRRWQPPVGEAAPDHVVDATDDP